MIEIRFHGRGGQGGVVASELLAQAAFLDGKRPQSFPFFGVERRGAPVTAYSRIDEHPIRLRTAVTTPDLVVVLDPGLLRAVAVTDGLRDGGMLITNSRLPPERVAVPAHTRVATVDARSIAVAHGLGSPTLPIVNTVMLGAVARASGVVSLSAVERAIEQFVPARPVENREAARDGYDSVRVGMGRAVDGPVATFPGAVLRPLPDGPVATVPSESLQTSAWRSLVPVLHLERCTRCNFCWKFCPDNAIRIGADGYPVLLPEYCKGCGICAEECPPRTIEMVAEEAVG
jgi:2-oxoacid:acceptor oxidoreductase gamma subunit (pyruvate/2-ketoisovalerate family)/2-oxoacid:acceptor oxidoreductase delta subunit (pyruvate/2-ketoisovalerate family)